MSFYNGNNIKIEIYGQSHSNRIGAKVFCKKRLSVDSLKLTNFCDRRHINVLGATSRVEKDLPIFDKIDNNVLDNNFEFYIENNDIKSQDYSYLYGKPRPSHADLTWFLKDGQLDFSGGGRFSGRMTATICVIGGIIIQYLEKMGIEIKSYVSMVGNVSGDCYKLRQITKDEIDDCHKSDFPSLSNKDEMKKVVKLALENGDSVGAKLDCIVYGLKSGIGNDMFDGIEGKLSNLIFSIPAVKGVEFGLGFDFCRSYGSEVNDQMQYKNDEIDFLSNNNGGILGGISNGQPLSISVAFKPTPSIAIEQKTVDLVKKENTRISINGRHDTCVALRALPVLESMVAIGIFDMLELEND